MSEEIGANAPNDESPEAATPRPSTNGSSTETVDQTGASGNPNLEAALSYLRRGWSVVPLRPRDKRPAVALAPYLDGSQRMSEADARCYWREHPDAGVRQEGHDLGDLVAVPVVVPEHGEDRNLQGPADLGQQRRLLRLAVGGQVARQQDEIDRAVDPAKRTREVVAIGVVGVDVACCCEADRPGHGLNSTDWRPRLRGTA